MSNSRGDATRAAILWFVRDYRTEHGYSPTVREIATGTGRSVNTIWLQLRILREKGLLTFEDRKARTVRVTR